MGMHLRGEASSPRTTTREKPAGRRRPWCAAQQVSTTAAVLLSSESSRNRLHGASPEREHPLGTAQDAEPQETGRGCQALTCYSRGCPALSGT